MLSCISQQKQIAAGVLIYSDDYSGNLPPSICYDTGNGKWSWPAYFNKLPGSASTNGGMVGTFLVGYVDTALLTCPMGAAAPPIENWTSSPNTWDYGHYNFFWNYGGLTGFDQPSMLSKESSSLMMGDATFHSSGSFNKWRSTHPFPSGYAGDPAVSNQYMYWTMDVASPIPLPRFRNHFAYTDGHVEAISSTDSEAVSVTTSSNGTVVLPKDH